MNGVSWKDETNCEIFSFNKWFISTRLLYSYIYMWYACMHYDGTPNNLVLGLLHFYPKKKKTKNAYDIMYFILCNDQKYQKFCVMLEKKWFIPSHNRLNVDTPRRRCYGWHETYFFSVFKFYGAKAMKTLWRFRIQFKCLLYFYFWSRETTMLFEVFNLFIIKSSKILCPILSENGEEHT